MADDQPGPVGRALSAQHRVGNYIADFHCRSPKLIVEVDGSQHVESEYDVRRDAWFRTQGYRVLRFWNRDVLLEPESVGEAIARAIRGE
ncbi:MAG TPA: endonuclease domain-containing protein [Caulobacteraceae bacterium]|nr:endonuclease domain-containing protein [Caulobacteraceae bacterium]